MTRCSLLLLQFWQRRVHEPLGVNKECGSQGSAGNTRLQQKCILQDAAQRDYARIVSKDGIMSAASPATEERAEHLQPLPGANTSMHSTCAPLPQREVV